MRNGCSYIAVGHNPGRPADDGGGWMMLAGRGPQGKTGKQGLMGPKGNKGEPGSRIEGWGVDKQRFRLWPRFDDGSFGPVAELRELFEEYFSQTANG
jgi:hypothetical protein